MNFARGKGYGTEGVRALIEAALDALGFDRVQAETMAVNQASRRVLEKAGLISLMEVLYRVWRDEDLAAGQLAYQQCQALPMEWLPNSEVLLLKAAEYKACFPLSIADAWIAACASEQGAILLHKDPDFKPLPVNQELLPLKNRQHP